MPRRRDPPCRPACLLVLLLLLPLENGCVTNYLAGRIAGPTNGGRDALPQSVDFHSVLHLDSWGSVTVGSGSAKLACFIFEPYPYAVLQVAPGDPPDWKAIGHSWGSRFRTSHYLNGPEQMDRPHVAIAAPDRADYQGPTPSVRGTILLLQGWGGSVTESPYLYPVAAALANAGYRVVMPDLRGQGLSTGDRIGLGAIDVRDLKQLITSLTEEGVIQSPIGVIGHSYGAGVGILLAAADPRVEAVVTLSAWHDWVRGTAGAIRTAGRQVAPLLYTVLSPVVSDAQLRRASALSLERAGIDRADASPLAKMPTMDTPVLLIHGTADQNCQPQWSKALYDARPLHTELLLLDGENHWSYLDQRWPTVKRAVLGWFDEHLKAGAEISDDTDTDAG